MVLPGHIGGGYLASKIVLSTFGAALSPSELLVLTIIGTLAGEFPDLDLIAFAWNRYFSKNKKRNHRYYITHTPIFWLCFAGIIFVISKFFSSPFILALSLVILAGTWSHFLLDSIEYGIRWLWPFSNKSFSLIKETPEENITAHPGSLMAYWQFITTAYVKTWSFWVELSITVVAIVCVIRNL